jgi:hypothetical protein
MKIKIDFTEEEMRKALRDYLEHNLGLDSSALNLTIEVKSKQNYKSEWEVAAFRGSLESK